MSLAQRSTNPTRKASCDFRMRRNDFRMCRNTKKARCYPRFLLIHNLCMVEYCRYLLDAVACPLAYLAIYVASADGVV